MSQKGDESRLSLGAMECDLSSVMHEKRRRRLGVTQYEIIRYDII